MLGFPLTRPPSPARGEGTASQRPRPAPSPLAGEGWGEGEPKAPTAVKATVNSRKRPLMVNRAMVNAKPPCTIHADFCENLLDSGRILRFKKPVKYVQRFDFNHKTVHPAAPGAATRRIFSRIINTIAGT